MAVIHDLHEVMALGRGECLQAPIIDEQQPDFSGLSQQFVVAAVGLGLGECKQQARQAVIAGRIPVQAGIVSQGTGQVGFATAARAGNEQVLCPLQPVSLGQPGNLGKVAGCAGAGNRCPGPWRGV